MGASWFGHDERQVWLWWFQRPNNNQQQDRFNFSVEMGTTSFWERLPKSATPTTIHTVYLL